MYYFPNFRDPGEDEILVEAAFLSYCSGAEIADNSTSGAKSI